MFCYLFLVVLIDRFFWVVLVQSGCNGQLDDYGCYIGSWFVVLVWCIDEGSGQRFMGW